jgi:type II secretory pathway component HofQ
MQWGAAMLDGMLCLWLAMAFADEPKDDAPNDSEPRDNGAVLIRVGGQVLQVQDAPLWTQMASDSTAKPISLDLVQADLLSVLRLIAEVGGINIVVGDDVSGRVTVRLVDVPWDQALAVIWRSQGLAAVPFGQIVLVTSPGH